MDFDLIVRKLGRDLESVNVYPLGDLHLGSQEFDVEMFNKWLRIVEEDENGLVVIAGDMLDNGLKDSKTDSYGQAIRIREQKKILAFKLKPIAEKILVAVQGNHEFRSSYLVDDCPMYDALAKIDAEDSYRENFGFAKISLGNKNSERQFTYTIAVAHGKSKTKAEKFAYAIDGMDIFITGHIHQPASTFPAKIVIDPYNDKVTMRGFKHVTVPSFQDFGGYALRDMYMPQDGKVIPIITLSGLEKEVKISWI